MSFKRLLQIGAVAGLLTGEITTAPPAEARLIPFEAESSETAPVMDYREILSYEVRLKQFLNNPKFKNFKKWLDKIEKIKSQKEKKKEKFTLSDVDLTNVITWRKLLTDTYMFNQKEQDRITLKNINEIQNELRRLIERIDMLEVSEHGALLLDPAADDAA